MKLMALAHVFFLFLLSVCTVHAAPDLPEIEHYLFDKPPVIDLRTIERYPFYTPPLKSMDDLRTMMQTHRPAIMEGLQKAGIPEVYTPLIQQFPQAQIQSVEYQPGEVFQWMLFRANGVGPVKIANNIIWGGKAVLSGYEFFIDAGGKRYIFVVPLFGGNLAVKEVVQIVVKTERVEVPVLKEVVKIERVEVPVEVVKEVKVEKVVSQSEFAVRNRLPNYTEMKVFFATDRKENAQSADVESRFTAQRGARIKYGVTKVSIPHDHKMGELESPSILRFEFRENPKKHVVLLDIDILEKSSYYRAISQIINKSPGKKALLYFHGFNVSFEDAARRTAQMTYDLDFDGAPVFYSWPTHGGRPHKYFSSEENIKWSKANIKRFLEEFVAESKAENIYLIGHSMGTRGLIRAYAELIKERPELRSRFSEIILAAPDIDVDVFKNDIYPVMAQANRTPTTLYASSDDVALMLSSMVHSGPTRLGDSRDGIHIFPGIESIDATDVGTDFLEHSYYGDSDSVISDLKDLITTRKRADKREQDSKRLIKHSNPAGIYWKLKGQ